MTWHAARLLLFDAIAFAFSGLLLFVAWIVVHRGRHLAKHPFVAALERHVHPSARSFVRVAIGVVIVAGALYWFFTIVRGVLGDGTVAGSDRRLHNTLRLFHSPSLHLFYSAITNVAGTLFVVPFTAALVLLFWLHHRHHDAIILAVATIGAVLSSIGLKYVVARPRPPDAAFMRGPSFPSGHTLAAAALYGTLAFLLIRETPRRWWHVAAAVPLIILIPLVAVSRVYLGVHWMHDVLASLAIGCALLACLTMLVKFRPDGRERPPVQHPIRAGRFAVFASVVIAYAIVLARLNVQREARPALPAPRPEPPAVVTALPRGLPRLTSEDLIGGPMEPLSFVFLGTGQSLERTFERAGWKLADTPSASGLAHELWCVLADRPDPNGPATPAYYAEQPQDFTFELSGDPGGSIRRRHHIRIWRAPICLEPQCLPVWVATASYDRGIEFVPKPYLITHRIDPDIDRERELIAASLRSAGAADVSVINVTGPRKGKNAGGDAFVTDGRGHVMRVSD